MPRQSSHPLSHSFTIVIFAHPLDVAKVQLSLAFLYLSSVLSEPCLFTSCPIALFSLLFPKRNKRSIPCSSPIGTHLSMETIENLPNCSPPRCLLRPSSSPLFSSLVSIRCVYSLCTSSNHKTSCNDIQFCPSLRIKREKEGLTWKTRP